MPGPAFQLRGYSLVTSGAFGTAPFGTAPFGGNLYPSDDIPTTQIGSDDLTESHRKFASETVHLRNGVPVSVRPWTTFRRWRVNYNMILEENLGAMQDYFDARIFNLLPSGDPSFYIQVRWVDQEFAPVYLSPGRYSLAFEIEEVPE